jgi:hypothetical protein
MFGSSARPILPRGPQPESRAAGRARTKSKDPRHANAPSHLFRRDRIRATMDNMPKPGDIATSAIAHIVSRVVPERFYSYLAAFLPGLFFEISLLLANSELVSRLLDQMGRSFALGRPMILTIALFLGFVIGNAFMLIPSLIQYFFFAPIYKLWWLFWRQFCVWPLKPIVEWLIKKPRLARIPEVLALHRYVINLGFATSPDETQRVWQCWLTLAARRLTERYGISPEDLSEGHQWGVLYWTLGIWEREDSRGNLLVIASEATGWAGLAATRLAPVLHTKYYLYFITFLITTGLLQDFYVTRRNVDPRASGYTHVRAVLRELRQLPQNKREDTKPVGADEVHE